MWGGGGAGEDWKYIYHDDDYGLMVLMSELR